MIETCKGCGEWKLIVFSNRWGERLCQPCLAKSMERTKARAQGEELPEEKPPRPVKVIDVEGVPFTFTYDGPPHHICVHGRKYIVSIPAK